MLSVLVSRLGNAISTDALIEAVWNRSPPRSARSSLRVHVSRIRQAIDLPDLLVTTEHGYRLQTDPQTVDAYRFELGVREGRRLVESGAHNRAVDALRLALEAWRGEPYEDAAHIEALQSEITRLHTLKAQAEVDLAIAELEVAGSNPDTSRFEVLVEADPLDERRWGLLMKALYRAGRSAEALDAYRRASEVLGEQLGLEPGPDLRTIEEQILLHDPGLQPAASTAAVILPGFATTMLGRSDQIATLAKRLAEHRVVTVTGLGGVGKTRLAVAAAQEALSDFPDGAVFVPLDSITTGALVADAVASHLGVVPAADPFDAVVSHIADRRLVMVLDNCEHVVEDVADLMVRLLAHCPGLGLLCTSRVPIGVTGETLFPVSPLPVPPTDFDFSTPAELRQFDSVDLFCSRASLARPEFTLDADNGPLVAEIVRRLAGIPLSIEIAAAKSDLLNPADILDRIGAGPQFLVSDERDRVVRHQSMADAVAWSLDLVEEPVRELFRRLGVFQSPVDIDTIHAVCQDATLDTAAIDGSLAPLVRSALVVADLETARARYSLLPPIRAVALEMLGSDESTLRHCHVAHYAAMAAEEVRHVGTATEVDSFGRLTAALPEVRSALNFAAERCADVGAQMSIDLGTYWIRTGRTTEGRAWVARFVEEEAQPEVTAALFHLAGSLALVEQELDAAEAGLAAAVALRRELDVPKELGMTLSNLGGLANSRRQYDKAQTLFLEAFEVFSKEGYGRGAAAAQLNLGLALLNVGDVESAAEEIQGAVDGFRRIGDRAEEAHALSRLGFAHAELGDPIRAEACRLAAHEISLELGRAPDMAYSHSTLAAHFFETGALDRAREHAAASAQLVVANEVHRWWIPELLELAAGISGESGDPAQGAQFLGCATAHRRAHDLPVPDAMREFRDGIQEKIEAALGQDQFVIELELGGTRSLLAGVRAVADWA